MADAAPFVVRQSDLKSFASCPLRYKYEKIDRLPREQSSALTFGTIIHDVVLFLEVTQDVEAAVRRFHRLWDDPAAFDPELEIDYYLNRTSFKKYKEDGERIIRRWWDLIQWESDAVIAREHEFTVPVGDGHLLHGTADKVCLRYEPSKNQRVLLISDYKTNRKEPTYDWLADDLQFSAYCYASTQPEFWATIPNGEQLFAELQGTPRWGEWVQLTGPKRKDAGERTEKHYKRLIIAINEIARTVEAGIFVPTISGDTCRYCQFRALCGLPEVADQA